MDILAFNFSPRKNGNSDAMLDEFLKGAKAAGAACEKFRVADMAILPCMECGHCEAAGECVLEDDDYHHDSHHGSRRIPAQPFRSTADRIVINVALLKFQ